MVCNHTYTSLASQGTPSFDQSDTVASFRTHPAQSRSRNQKYRTRPRYTTKATPTRCSSAVAAHPDPSVSLPRSPLLHLVRVSAHTRALALPSPSPATVVAGRELDLLNSAPGSCSKRSFADALGGVKASADAATAIFASWHDDDGNGGRGGDSDGEMGNKRRKLVGWPPVKCLHRRRDGGGGGGGYVKVKMEGVAIGRKLDLSILGSYAELLDTLHRMFPSTNQDQDDGHHRRRHPYAVTYEDGEGDWLLVGDVPWEAFAKSVKRLKILV